MQPQSGFYNYVVGQYGNNFATPIMEYLAAYVLVKNEARWRIPPLERKENRMRLRRFSCTIVASIEGLPWHLRLKLSYPRQSRGFIVWAPRRRW